MPFSLSLGERLGFNADNDRSFRRRQRLLDRFSKSGADFGCYLEPIDDNGDIVLDAPIELEIVGEPNDLPVDAGTDEAPFQHFCEKILEFPFLTTDNRSENKKAGILRDGQNTIDDLFAHVWAVIGRRQMGQYP